jgi:hypothetical protein
LRVRISTYKTGVDRNVQSIPLGRT